MTIFTALIFMSPTNLSFGQIINYLLDLSGKVTKFENITYPSQEGTVFCTSPCSVCRRESTAAFLHPYHQRELKTRSTPVRQTHCGLTLLYITNNMSKLAKVSIVICPSDATVAIKVNRCCLF